MVAVDAAGGLIPLNAPAVALLTTPDIHRHPALRHATTAAGTAPVGTVVHVQTPGTSLRVRVVSSDSPDLRCVLIFSDDRGPHAIARGYRLTNREREVLSLLASGQIAEAVARRMRLSPRTVQKHLERVYLKLAVHDRLSAVLRAQELGILDRDSHGAP